MASYNVTTEAEALIAAGVDFSDLRIEKVYETPDGTGRFLLASTAAKHEHRVRYYAGNASSCDAMAARAGQIGRQSAVEPEVAMATDRQIARAMSLAIKNAPGSLELTVEQCRRMTRRQISDLITSLQNQW